MRVAPGAMSTLRSLLVLLLVVMCVTYVSAQATRHASRVTPTGKGYEAHHAGVAEGFDRQLAHAEGLRRVLQGTHHGALRGGCVDEEG